jgi:hypothetical protein
MAYISLTLLLQMIIGTSPIILLIFPTCAAGAFMLKSSQVSRRMLHGESSLGHFIESCRWTIHLQGGVWASVSTFMLMLASGVQGGALLAAFYCIERTATKHKTELKSWPLDMDVKAVGTIHHVSSCPLSNSLGFVCHKTRQATRTR